VNWSGPDQDGGGEIEEYRIVMDNGEDATISGSSLSSYDWTNLTNGVARQFQVQARNRAGWGPLSGLSAPIQPCGAPGAPTITSATRANQQVDLVFSAAAANGCSVTNYVITSGDGTVQNSTSLAHNFTGLNNGTPYTFTVVAQNEIGDGPPSASSTSVTPAGPPICRTSASMSATPNNPGSVAVSWSDAITNGAPITNYLLSYGGTTDTLGNVTSFGLGTTPAPPMCAEPRMPPPGTSRAP